MTIHISPEISNFSDLISEAMVKLTNSNNNESVINSSNLSNLNEIFDNFDKILKLRFGNTDEIIEYIDAKYLIKYQDYYFTIYIDITHRQNEEFSALDFKFKCFNLQDVHNAWRHYNSL